MTKEGYKQVMLSIDTYGKLKNESIRQKISIGKLIDGLFEGVSLPTLNPLISAISGLHGRYVGAWRRERLT